MSSQYISCAWLVCIRLSLSACNTTARNYMTLHYATHLPAAAAAAQHAAGDANLPISLASGDSDAREQSGITD